MVRFMVVSQRYVQQGLHHHVYETGASGDGCTVHNRAVVVMFGGVRVLVRQPHEIDRLAGRIGDFQEVEQLQARQSFSTAGIAESFFD